MNTTKIKHNSYTFVSKIPKLTNHVLFLLRGKAYIELTTGISVICSLDYQSGSSLLSKTGSIFNLVKEFQILQAFSTFT